METKNVIAGRTRSVDVAKGIAIIFIILGHLNVPSINRFVFTFHVPIFYLITGYYLRENKTVAEVIRKKGRTLLIPYAVICLVIITLGTLKGVLQGSGLSEFKEWLAASIYGAGGTLNHPFHIRGIGAIWFLWALFWGSVFLQVSFKLDERIRPVFIAALFLTGVITKKWIWLPLSLQESACAAFFLYIGFLYRKAEKTLQELPAEVKWFSALFALAVWVFFIKDFQSFWLVQCDFGRGIVDIFGSVCACAVVLLISGMIDRRINPLAKFFAFFGRYSLLALCVHIVELDLFPWTALVGKVIRPDMPDAFEVLFLIAAKLILDLCGAWLLSKIRFVRKLFGYTDHSI